MERDFSVYNDSTNTISHVIFFIISNSVTAVQ